MHFEIVKCKECNLRCSISSEEKAVYTVRLFYESNGRQIQIGNFCEKHFQEFLNEIKNFKI